MRGVLEMALEALRYHTEQTRPIFKTEEAIASLKEAIKQQNEPVAKVACVSFEHGCVLDTLLPEGTKLYTSAPTIPKGWQLVPKEPTQKMLETAYLRIESEGIHTTPWMRGSIYKAMLSAAPEYKGEQP